MDAIFLQLLNGLDKGGAYALIALGLTLIFGTLGVVNFTHGALFMLGAFCAVSMQMLLRTSKQVKDTSVTFFDSYIDVPYLQVWFGDTGLQLINYAVPLSILLAIPLMLLTGFAGGMLMVPMNALLQSRGYALLTAGRSIAVQGFNENASVMVMLGIYSALLAMSCPLKWVMTLLGTVMTLGVLYLMRMASQRTDSTCSAI
jgi:branched-chain amino acid transport system permease protein